MDKFKGGEGGMEGGEGAFSDPSATPPPPSVPPSPFLHSVTMYLYACRPIIIMMMMGCETIWLKRIIDTVNHLIAINFHKENIIELEMTEVVI